MKKIKTLVVTVLSAVIINMATTLTMDIVKYPEHEIMKTVSRASQTFLWDFSQKDSIDIAKHKEFELNKNK